MLETLLLVWVLALGVSSAAFAGLVVVQALGQVVGRLVRAGRAEPVSAEVVTG